MYNASDIGLNAQININAYNRKKNGSSYLTLLHHVSFLRVISQHLPHKLFGKPKPINITFIIFNKVLFLFLFFNNSMLFTKFNYFPQYVFNPFIKP